MTFSFLCDQLFPDYLPKWSVPNMSGLQSGLPNMRVPESDKSSLRVLDKCSHLGLVVLYSNVKLTLSSFTNVA